MTYYGFSTGMCKSGQIVPNAVILTKPMRAFWRSILPGRISVPDTSRSSYHSPGTSGFACRDRVVVRFVGRGKRPGQSAVSNIICLFGALNAQPTTGRAGSKLRSTCRTGQPASGVANQDTMMLRRSARRIGVPSPCRRIGFHSDVRL